MKSLQVTMLRFLLVFWCGAATLFVVTSVREVTSSRLDEAAKNVLPVLRFPLYYAFGFTCVTLSTALAALTSEVRWSGRMRRRLVLLGLVVALLTMIGDFVFIYRPLHSMLEAGEYDATRFETYHQASKWVNAAGLLICYACGLFVCFPGRDR